MTLGASINPRQQRHDTRKTSTRAALPLLALAASLLLPQIVTAIVYEVSPEGLPYTIEEALAVAGAGDIVSLADGIYNEPIVTIAGGAEGAPLIIEGGPGAVINAAYGDTHRMVYVQHSWVMLQVSTGLYRVGFNRKLVHCTYPWSQVLTDCTVKVYVSNFINWRQYGGAIHSEHVKNAGQITNFTRPRSNLFRGPCSWIFSKSVSRVNGRCFVRSPC